MTILILSPLFIKNPLSALIEENENVCIYFTEIPFLGIITFNFVCFLSKESIVCDLQHYHHKASSITMYTLLMSRLLRLHLGYHLLVLYLVQSHALNNNDGYFPPQIHQK